MLNQEEIHRYFNCLSGTKRIEFLYGLLHLCQPLELRYIGTCLEEIARKDYEYLYHAEQKTNHLSSEQMSSVLPSPLSSQSEQVNQQIDVTVDEKLDLSNEFVRAQMIVDIALLWAKNRPCAMRLFRQLKESESIKLVDMFLERDDLDERAMDEILIIYCLASNHPAFSFDMRTQMSQIFKELEKRRRKMKVLQMQQNNNSLTKMNINTDDDHHQDYLGHDNDDALDESTCFPHHILSSSLQNSNILRVHASPLLSRITVVNFDVDITPMKILIKADWSDSCSSFAWKTVNDIRSFHLQLSNVVYHDDIRLERLMNISGYLRDAGSTDESDIPLMKNNINIYMTHLVYFSSYISTIAALAKFFNSSLKLVDSKKRFYNSNVPNYDAALPSSPPYTNGLVASQCEASIPQQVETDNKTVGSPKLSLNMNKCKQQMDIAKQARSLISTQNIPQTGAEVRCEETQTDRIPGPAFILAEYQDYLRKYSMDELASLTANDLIVDGLNSSTAQLICNALEDLKPMSIHLHNMHRVSRPSCTLVPAPPVPSSPAGLPPLLDAALMAVVQQQQQQTSMSSTSSTSSSRTPPPGFDRNQLDHLLMNFTGVRASLVPSPTPKVSKTGTMTTVANSNGPQSQTAQPSHSTVISTSSSSTNGHLQNQHHPPLLPTHSFLYNPVEPCIFPVAIPPGFPSGPSDFMRLFTPNMGTVTAAAASNSATSSSSQPSAPNPRSAAQSSNTNTPSEQNAQNIHLSSSSTSSTVSRHQQPQHYRHKQVHPSETYQYQQNSYHHPSSSYHHHHHYHHQPQQRLSQTSFSQQQHNRPKACYICGDIGHLSFACPEQSVSDSTYVQNTREGYKLDYRPRQSTPTNFHQHHQQQVQQQQHRPTRSTSKNKTRDNS